jgi:demethylspheroidene O-methyltransferase
MTAIVPNEAREIGWRERWIGWRNRIIATPAFQRWAAESIFTKFVARRRARALFDICAGFVYSQVLLACVRLRLFDMLARGPLPLDVLAERFDMSRDSAERLLKAAVALQLLRSLPGDRYALGDLGASMLGNPSIADFVEHHTILYQDLSDPLALLRGQKETQLSKFWPYAEDKPGSAKPRPQDIAPDLQAYADYSALMASSQALIADDILAAYPLGKHKRLLDVGGGEGAFIEAAARANPNLQFELFDLPPVAAQARARFSRLSLYKRVNVTGGSFLQDPLPTGADVISFVRIIHDHDDESVEVMLRAAYNALPPGGTLLLAEPMAEAPGAEPVGDAYFGFYLLAMGRGRARSASDLARLMESAGFTAVRSCPTRRPLLTSLIIGHRV